VAGVKECGYRH